MAKFSTVSDQYVHETVYDTEKMEEQTWSNRNEARGKQAKG